MSGCGQHLAQDTVASEKDYQLADKVHFEHAVMDNLRQLTNADITLLRSAFNKHVALQFDYSNESELTAGEKRTFNEVKAALKKKGYLLFKSAVQGHDGPDKFAVLHAADQFDIIRFRGTCGPTYGITNGVVLQQLQDWNNHFGIEITGADEDWVELHISGLPAAKAGIFVQDLFDFCPDLAKDGAESLLTRLKDNRRIMLWWE